VPNNVRKGKGRGEKRKESEGGKGGVEGRKRGKEGALLISGQRGLFP